MRRTGGRLSLAVAMVVLVARGTIGAPKPHVILVSLCSVRADHLGCYGNPRATSPAIDALARDSVVFEHAVTPWPKTAPSFSSVMTGLWPHETGIMRTTPNQHLADGPLTVAERFKEAGYRTAAFVTSPALNRLLNLTQGFDRYEETFRDRAARQGTVEGALAWLAEKPDEPSLLWVHLNDAHYPYTPRDDLKDLFVDDAHYDRSRRVRLNDEDLPIPLPANHPARRPVLRPDLGGVHPLARLKGRSDELAFYVARYDAAIRTADEQIGRLLAGVRSTLGDRPFIVVLWADHGESLGEHDYFFEHGRFAYETCTRVPLIVHAPGRWPAGRRVADPVSTVDLVPTLAELAGLPATGLSGVSLVRVVDGGARRGDVFFFGGYHEDFITGIRRGPHKLLRVSNAIDRQMMRGRPHELYDVGSDPMETRDLAPERPEVVRQLDGTLATWIAPWWSRAVAVAARPEEKYDSELRVKLKALGYVGD